MFYLCIIIAIDGYGSMIKVHCCHKDCIGKNQEEDENVEPGHLENALEKWRSKTTWLALIDCYHPPSLSVTEQNLSTNRNVLKLKLYQQPVSQSVDNNRASPKDLGNAVQNK